MIRALMLTSAACGMLFFVQPASAATLAECAAKWSEMKAEGKTDGLVYREFSSKCMKDDASADDQPAKKKSAEKPKKKQVVEIDDEGDGDSNGSGALKRECDAKWKVHKASTGASGWKPYFTFMAKCM